MALSKTAREKLNSQLRKLKSQKAELSDKWAMAIDRNFVQRLLDKTTAEIVETEKILED